MSDIVVETTSGKVRGVHSGSVACWKGIPFAQPPLGKLRFRAPQPPIAWSGVLDATTFRSTAAQDIAHLVSLTRGIGGQHELTPEGSENCLYLNVWSPSADQGKRPVMVWIHGGAFLIGSGSQTDYDGSTFASQGDVVVVTLNYRLGLTGFLHLAELGGEAYASAGNSGLLDQIAALRWVQENIAAFGGDPNNVTIFGESAGAMSIGALLSMPAARGLFQKAILESGAAHNVQSSQSATEKAGAVLQILGIEPEHLSDLADIPLERLLEAQAAFLKKYPGLSIGPVIDGQDIPERPLNALAKGVASDISILIGTNRHEMALFTSANPEAEPDNALAERALGNRALEVFMAYSSAQPGADMRTLGLDMFTDYVFRIPAIRLAEEQVRQSARVWMYRFDWPSPDERFRACHALEMPFVWDNFQGSFFRALLGEHPPRHLARAMHAAWLAFAHTGNPNTPDLPAWPAYELERRATMLFNERCEVVEDPQGRERAVWQELL